MSIRVDSSSLIAGAVVVGVPGLGVLAEAVPSTGEHGAGFLYASLAFPGDNGKEVRGLITSWPTLGTLTAFEDSSFEYDGPTDAFAFQMYVDGVAVGTPQAVTMTVGAAIDLAGASAAQANSSTTGAVGSLGHTLSGTNAQQVAVTATGAITQVHTPAGAGAVATGSTSTGAAQQTHVIQGASTSQASTTSSGSTPSSQSLQGNNPTQVATSSTGAVQQTHNLTPAGVLATHVTGTGQIAQSHILIGNSTSQAVSTTAGATHTVTQPYFIDKRRLIRV